MLFFQKGSICVTFVNWHNWFTLQTFIEQLCTELLILLLLECLPAFLFLFFKFLFSFLPLFAKRLLPLLLVLVILGSPLPPSLIDSFTLLLSLSLLGNVFCGSESGVACLLLFVVDVAQESTKDDEHEDDEDHESGVAALGPFVIYVSSTSVRSLTAWWIDWIPRLCVRIFDIYTAIVVSTCVIGRGCTAASTSIFFFCIIGIYMDWFRTACLNNTPTKSSHFFTESNSIFVEIKDERKTLQNRCPQNVALIGVEVCSVLLCYDIVYLRVVFLVLFNLYDAFVAIFVVFEGFSVTEWRHSQGEGTEFQVECWQVEVFARRFATEHLIISGF